MLYGAMRGWNVIDTGGARGEGGAVRCWVTHSSDMGGPVTVVVLLLVIMLLQFLHVVQVTPADEAATSPTRLLRSPTQLPHSFIAVFWSPLIASPGCPPPLAALQLPTTGAAVLSRRSAPRCACCCLASAAKTSRPGGRA